MVSPLSAQGIGASSTYRELEGIAKLDLALIPTSCDKAYVIVDNLAVVQILARGSRIPALQRLVVLIFKKCMACRRVLIFGFVGPARLSKHAMLAVGWSLPLTFMLLLLCFGVPMIWRFRFGGVVSSSIGLRPRLTRSRWV
jgi:hypothetical protein